MSEDTREAEACQSRYPRGRAIWYCTLRKGHEGACMTEGSDVAWDLRSALPEPSPPASGEAEGLKGGDASAAERLYLRNEHGVSDSPSRTSAVAGAAHPTKRGEAERLAAWLSEAVQDGPGAVTPNMLELAATLLRQQEAALTRVQALIVTWDRRANDYLSGYYGSAARAEGSTLLEFIGELRAALHPGGSTQEPPK